MPENKHADEFDSLVKGYKYIKLRLIQHAAAIALAFFKQSFVKQGFTDQAFTPWESRIPGTPNNTGRGILMGGGAGSGTLKRGLRIKQANMDGAIVGLDDALSDPRTGYGYIQNFGGQIPITPKMRRFFWAMYYQAGAGQAPGKSKRAATANSTAQFYMNLAITKEQFITIPARQFIGDSATLENQLRDYITTELDKFFKIDEY